jgi:CheY-like chemotaxis protein
MHIQQEASVILIVDDEQQVLDGVETVLSVAGYECCCCTTAETAISLAKSIGPALIISDINLQGHSGLEMCEQIKEDPAMADVPVMFLSGAQIPDIIRRSHAVGGTYYLRKPFDPEVLVELVDKALWMPHLVSNRAAANARQPAHH